MMVMEWDYFFMFYSTLFLFLCYMDTHLTTRLVASRYGMSECILPRATALHIGIDVPDARDDAGGLKWYLWMQDTEGQVVSMDEWLIMSFRQTRYCAILHRSLERLHTVPLHTYQHNF